MFERELWFYTATRAVIKTNAPCIIGSAVVAVWLWTESIHLLIGLTGAQVFSHWSGQMVMKLQALSSLY